MDDHPAKFSRPSNGTILGFVALFISLGGVAYAATNLVTIQDSVTAAKARVLDGRLQTDPGLVTTQLARPASFFHSTTLGVTSTSGCVKIATPPKPNVALVVTQVRVNVFRTASTGPTRNVALFLGTTATCSTQVGDVNPATVGQTVVPFDPGLGIPQGFSLFANVGSPDINAEIFVDGFSVPKVSVPVADADELVVTGSAAGNAGRH